MKMLAKLSLVLLLVSSTYFTSFSKTPAPNKGRKHHLFLRTYVLSGGITNATVNKKGHVKIQITEIANGKFKCHGQLDGNQLYGRFDMYGEAFHNPDAPKALSINFNGQIAFGGGDGSGFAPGTKTTFSSTFNIFTENVTGEYVLDEIPNSDWSRKKQNGLYTLNIDSHN